MRWILAAWYVFVIFAGWVVILALPFLVLAGGVWVVVMVLRGTGVING